MLPSRKTVTDSCVHYSVSNKKNLIYSFIITALHSSTYAKHPAGQRTQGKAYSSIAMMKSPIAPDFVSVSKRLNDCVKSSKCDGMVSSQSNP